MNKVFRKTTCLYRPKHILQNEKVEVISSSSIEPSERTTFSKAEKNPKNALINDNKFQKIQNKEKENLKILTHQEITEFPILKQLKKKKDEIETGPEKIKKNEKYYLSREIALTIEKYGRELFSCVKNNEPRFLIPIDFMDKHNMSKYIRERMVNWMVEVFNAYKCDPGTFELAVHIMDCFIARTKKKLKDEDIHLIGLTCIYISSKVEDIIPLRMSHIAKNIGHGTFNEKQIIKKEREIIQTIDFDLFTAGTYDYIMTFFYDLKVNNSPKINDLNGENIINKYLNISIFLSQLLLYSSEFVCYRQSLNALAVLALAFDILKTNIKDMSKDLKNFLTDWVFYVINEMGLNADAISIIYQKFYNYYSEKVILPQKIKERNLRKGLKDDGDDDIINLCKFNYDKFI